MQQISQAIGGRIRALRKSQGLTLQQLSEKIHKSRASLSKYEAGEIVLDVETLYEISKALDVDIRQLLDACPRKIATTPCRTTRSRAPSSRQRSFTSTFTTADAAVSRAV